MLLQRNLLILFFCQGVFGAGAVLVTTVGGVVGSRIAPSPELATLPVSLMVVATALGTVPASLFMSRFGRRAGIAAAALVAAAGAATGAAGASSGAFVPFCAGAAAVGLSMATAQQLRFAAAESVPAAQTGRAVSFILLGSIGGAFLGSGLVSWSAALLPADPFRIAFLGLAGAHGLVLAVTLLMRPVGRAGDMVAAAPDEPSAPRPWGTLLRAPGLLLAVAAAVVGQGTMTFLMTATPVAMHVMDGHALEVTARAIRAHVIAMYAPSLLAGLLISRLGLLRMMGLGAALLLVCVIVGLLGHEVMHYTSTLVLLGVGWNFLFVGGTTALVAAYRPSERFRVQAFNDFCVFGSAATASLLAGALVLTLGWERVLLLPVPALLGMCLATAWLARRRRREAARAAARAADTVGGGVALAARPGSR